MNESMPWLRLYTEVVDDEKLRLLAFEDRWHYIALLCLKRSGVLDDTDALMKRKVAVKLGLHLQALDEVVKRLADVGLIDRETLQPLGWNKRQRASDKDITGAERQRRYRDSRKRNALRHVTVTEPSRKDNGAVTRLDTDKERIPISNEIVSTASVTPLTTDATDTLKSDEPGAAQCPHATLIDLFAEHLPMLPKPKAELWKGTRARDMRNRWRWVLTAKTRGGKHYAETSEQAVDFFKRFFGYVAQSDFLTGRNGRWPGCTLAWLMEEANFAKVMEGNFDNPSKAEAVA